MSLRRINKEVRFSRELNNSSLTDIQNLLLRKTNKKKSKLSDIGDQNALDNVIATEGAADTETWPSNNNSNTNNGSNYHYYTSNNNIVNNNNGLSKRSLEQLQQQQASANNNSAASLTEFIVPMETMHDHGSQDAFFAYYEQLRKLLEEVQEQVAAVQETQAQQQQQLNHAATFGNIYFTLAPVFSQKLQQTSEVTVKEAMLTHAKHILFQKYMSAVTALLQLRDGNKQQQHQQQQQEQQAVSTAATSIETVSEPANNHNHNNNKFNYYKYIIVPQEEIIQQVMNMQNSTVARDFKFQDDFNFQLRNSSILAATTTPSGSENNNNNTEHVNILLQKQQYSHSWFNEQDDDLLLHNHTKEKPPLVPTPLWKSLINKFSEFLPLLTWIPLYFRNLSWIFSDIFAGLTCGVMLIPQGMAYSLIAGLPPIYGLYTSFIPVLVYGLLGSCRQLAVRKKIWTILL